MLTQQDVVELDAAVEHLLRTGDPGQMEIIGAGEITCVVAWRGCACKRLPPFDDPARLAAYDGLLQEYLTRLKAAGVMTLPTETRIVSKAGRQVAYLVQPRIAAEHCLPTWMQRVAQPEAVAMAVQVMELVRRATSQGVGIDANLSNWLVQNDAPVYLDVSTPMLRDEAGRHRLDTEIFVATLPGVVRGLVRRYFVTDLLDRYFVTRQVFENLLGDLPNSGLDHLTGVLLAEANARIDTPLTMAQILAYRKEDRLTWNAIRQLLKAEQWWRRHILRAAHPHLLPSQFRRT
jgi:Family of unknown function (DUF6206)